MAIPVILKGETPKPIPLALKEGYDYSGCCLHVEFCGLQDTFINLEAGGRVDLRYTAEQTAVLPLGTSKVMLSLENANGEVRFMPWAKIKVTDSPADLYDGVITIDPATLDVDDLTAADSLGTVKDRLQAVISFLRALKVLALAALPFVACADVAPLYTTPNEMPGDAQLMTNTEAYVEAKMGLIPMPDFSTNNTELVETIEATAPAPGDYANVSNKAVNAVQTEADPNVPAWAKKTVGDFYSYNLYSLVNRDFYAKDSSIKSQNTIWLKGDSKPTVTVGRDKISDNTFPYSRQTVLGFSAYEGFDYYAHYRPRGIYIWPWWNEDAEDSIAYLFPTNGNGGTFALTSDFSTNNAALVETIEATAPAPGDYANVSNAAVRAAITNALQDAELESLSDSISTLSDTKLDKEGGTVTGELIVSHPITVGSVGNERVYGVNSISQGSNHIDFPSTTGTIALTSDIPPAVSNIVTAAYINDRVNVTPLAGRTYDFATNIGLYTAVRDVILALGGSVTNFPAIPQN